MDALSMQFESNSFDVVIDKGTLDALCCGSDYSMAEDLVREMLRVCKKEGSAWLITNSAG
jgi:ubiquinone/menaquinone biosynthesis C-methylase UbiE